VALVISFEVRDRERSLAAAREEALAAQMRALRYQVNPHFLFNTLNSIAGLIEEGGLVREVVVTIEPLIVQPRSRAVRCGGQRARTGSARDDFG
jgi:hypothetical protein